MRLIQPTLLLLLVAIHCESCPEFRQEPPDWEKKLQKCITEKCQKQIDRCKLNWPRECFRDDHHCFTKTCKKVQVEECFQKAKDECMKKIDLSCPGVGANGPEVLVNRRELAKEFGKKVWWAVATEDRYQDGFLNDPCSKYKLSAKCDKNGQEWVYLEFTTCPGNSQTGECWTARSEIHYGIGMQIGNSGIIEFTLTKKDFLAPTNPDGTNKLTLYVRQMEKGAYAEVWFCGTIYGRLLESKRMIFSPENSYDSLRRNIDNATLAKLDQAVSKFGGPVYAMKNGKHCTN